MRNPQNNMQMSILLLVTPLHNMKKMNIFFFVNQQQLMLTISQRTLKRLIKRLSNMVCDRSVSNSSPFICFNAHNVLS